MRSHQGISVNFNFMSKHHNPVQGTWKTSQEPGEQPVQSHSSASDVTIPAQGTAPVTQILCCNTSELTLFDTTENLLCQHSQLTTSQLIPIPPSGQVPQS